MTATLCCKHWQMLNRKVDGISAGPNFTFKRLTAESKAMFLTESLVLLWT